MANTIVCMCGSGKYWREADRVSLSETIKGNIILGFVTTDRDAWRNLSVSEKEYVEGLHFAKIDMCDEVYFMNVHGYVGNGGKNQIAYALSRGKRIRFYDGQLGEAYMETFRKELGVLVARFAAKN